MDHCDWVWEVDMIFWAGLTDLLDSTGATTSAVGRVSNPALANLTSKIRAAKAAAACDVLNDDDGGLRQHFAAPASIK